MLMVYVLHVVIGINKRCLIKLRMMKINWKKDWATTVGAIVGTILVVAGFLWPEKVDLDTQEIIKSATNEIIVGVGALINIITGWLAKDPELPKISVTLK